MADWQQSISTPELTPGEVHVWRIRLDIADDSWRALASLLTNDERIKAERFHFEKHRRRHIVGRAALRTLLGQYLDRSPQLIEFSYNSHGKPRLARSDSGIRFNLSHTEEIMLVAFALDSEVGIDIESLMRDVDCMDVGQRWFSGLEGQALRALPEDARRDAFFRIWSRKEAYIKARGDGISHPLHRFSVSMDKHEPRLIEHQDDTSEKSRWRFIDIDVGEKYQATVVVKSSHWKLRFHCLCRPPFHSWSRSATTAGQDIK